MYSQHAVAPPSLEVVLDRPNTSTIHRLVSQLENLDFSVDVLRSSRSLANYVSNCNKMRFPYVGVINLSAGIPTLYRTGQAAILLEMINVPYSGSDPQALLVMRDKALCKLVAEKVGVKTPSSLLVTEFEPKLLSELCARMFPLIVKPNTSSTSIGISKIIDDNEKLVAQCEPKKVRANPEGILVEQFIYGREITVLRVGNGPNATAVPLILREKNGDDLPGDFIYSMRDKTSASLRSTKTSWFLARDFLSLEAYKQLLHIANILASALRTRDLVRFDFRLSEDDNCFYFIESNGQPSLNHHEGSVVNTINRLWFREEGKTEYEYLRAALKRMALIDT